MLCSTVTLTYFKRTEWIIIILIIIIITTTTTTTTTYLLTYLLTAVGLSPGGSSPTLVDKNKTTQNNEATTKHKKTQNNKITTKQKRYVHKQNTENVSIYILQKHTHILQNTWNWNNHSTTHLIK
jgi:hypothetical protein